MAPSFSIVPVATSSALATYLPGLTTTLQACINEKPSESSLWFLAPLGEEEATAYWQSVGENLGESATHLWVAVKDNHDDDDDSNKKQVIGTVQLVRSPKATQKHRADVVKLLVHPSQQRQGLGRTLLDHAETYGHDQLGLTLLTLDVKTNLPARQLYLRRGWIEIGVIPGYADGADGKRGDVSFFYKNV